MDLSDALQAIDDHMHKIESGKHGPVESRPAPADLSDKEVIDWLDEYGLSAMWNRGTDEKVGHWKIYSDEIGGATTGKTLREAVKRAAAMMEEN